MPEEDFPTEDTVDNPEKSSKKKTVEPTLNDYLQDVYVSLDGLEKYISRLYEEKSNSPSVIAQIQVVRSIKRSLERAFPTRK